MVGLAKIDNFLHNLRACLIGRVFEDRFLVRQARFALFLKGRLPSVKTCPADAEVPTGPAHIPQLLSIAKNAQLALNFLVVFSHRDHASCPKGLKDVSQVRTYLHLIT